MVWKRTTLFFYTFRTCPTLDGSILAESLYHLFDELRAEIDCRGLVSLFHIFERLPAYRQRISCIFSPCIRTCLVDLLILWWLLLGLIRRWYYSFSCFEILFASLKIVLLLSLSKFCEPSPIINILLKCPEEFTTRHRISFWVILRAYQWALVRSIHYNIILAENLATTHQSYLHILCCLFFFIFMVFVFFFHPLDFSEFCMGFSSILMNWVRAYFEIPPRERLLPAVLVLLNLWCRRDIFAYFESTFVDDENLFWFCTLLSHDLSPMTNFLGHTEMQTFESNSW